MSFIVIIPARYQSTRLPGKPLIEVNGRPLIQWVYDQAKKSMADRVVVATDDERVRRCVEGFGGEAVMTSEAHQSGTDRLHEAADLLKLQEATIIVNVQGDEPMMPPELINAVAKRLTSDSEIEMATVCSEFTNTQDINDPNKVKVVLNSQGRAMYFSRSPIPSNRNHISGQVFHHLGIYAYRTRFLKQFARWPVCDLEKMESLEQLRVLVNGAQLGVVQSESTTGIGIDTPEDLKIWQSLANQ